MHTWMLDIVGQVVTTVKTGDKITYVVHIHVLDTLRLLFNTGTGHIYESVRRTWLIILHQNTPIDHCRAEQIASFSYSGKQDTWFSSKVAKM